MIYEDQCSAEYLLNQSKHIDIYSSSHMDMNNMLLVRPKFKENQTNGSRIWLFYSKRNLSFLNLHFTVSSTHKERVTFEPAMHANAYINKFINISSPRVFKRMLCAVRIFGMFCQISCHQSLLSMLLVLVRKLMGNILLVDYFDFKHRTRISKFILR